MGTPTKAKSTKGTLVKAGDAEGGSIDGTYYAIGEVESFDGPNGEAPDIEVSNFDSTEEEFIPGLSAPGELQMNGNFVGSDSMQQQLDSDRVAGTRRYFELTLNDHSTTPTRYRFLGYVKSFGLSGATKAAYKFKATVKITGTVTKRYRPS